ncbi:MAG: hypothetical protein Q9170_003647 [Blastenia crenularia]
MPPILPGFHYDDKTGRYFKIIEDHAATANSKHSKSAIRQENQRKKESERLKEYHNRLSTKTVTRNTLLQVHPLGGFLGLKRELGDHEGRTVSSAAVIWTKGLEHKPLTHNTPPKEADEPWRNVRHFIEDPGTGAIAFSTNMPEYSTHVNNVHNANETDRYHFHVGKALGLMPFTETSSLSISPSRAVLATGLGDGRTPPSIHLVRLLEPQAYFANLERLEHRRSMYDYGTSAFNQELDVPVGCQVQLPSKTKSIWCSVAGPHTDRAVFAIGTACGVELVEMRDRYLDPSVHRHDWPRSNQAHNTFAVDFWNHNVVLAGTRNGKVRVWDIRSNGSNVRFKHPSSTTHIRATNENKVLVAGLDRKLSMYDVRFLKAFPQSEQSKNLLPSQPLYDFPAYRVESYLYPKLGFDVYRNLVASGTEDKKVQIFDLTSGKELDIGATGARPNDEVLSHARCLKFVEHDDNGDGLRLLVANGSRIDAWAW